MARVSQSKGVSYNCLHKAAVAGMPKGSPLPLVVSLTETLEPGLTLPPSCALLQLLLTTQPICTDLPRSTSSSR